MKPNKLNVKQQGFTLLELVISMTLTAMLLGMLSAGIYSVVNDWQRETTKLDEELDKALVILQIERAIQAAFPHSYIHASRLSRMVYFHGNAEELSFVSSVSPQRHNMLTAWNLVSNEATGLLLRLTPAFSDNPDLRLEQAVPTILLPNYQARFRYLVQADVDDKQWIEEWPAEEMQSLPLAVEVVLTPINDDIDEQILEIIAPIRVYRHENIEPTLPSVF